MSRIHAIVIVRVRCIPCNLLATTSGCRPHTARDSWDRLHSLSTTLKKISVSDDGSMDEINNNLTNKIIGKKSSDTSNVQIEGFLPNLHQRKTKSSKLIHFWLLLHAPCNCYFGFIFNWLSHSINDCKGIYDRGSFTMIIFHFTRARSLDHNSKSKRWNKQQLVT